MINQCSLFVQDIDMKKEYDFSNAVRGKIYHKDVQLNLPIYLDKDIADFIHKVANQKKTDSQSRQVGEIKCCVVINK